MRYIWEAAGDYAPSVPGGVVGRAAFAALSRYLRRWDVASTRRVQVLVANSRYTQERIHDVYGRDAEVIEPPVDTARFAAIPDPPPAAGAPVYLCVSALVPYKRVDLAVRAFAAPGRRGRLVVVGDGPERGRIARLAGPNVELAGRVDDDALTRLYAACHAVIHPALDDFGIVPVEALAAGRPVVAFAAGGSLASVQDGETGVLFRDPTPEALGAALDRLEALTFAPAALRAAARRFDRASFEARFGALVEAELRARRGP
jgi:glycosyltransferase involved in cell wall biosynthesis